MSSELLDKIEKLAIASTQLDQELADLPALVEASQLVDELKVSLAQEQPPELSALYDGLAQVLDKYMLGGAEASDAPAYLEILNDTVSISRDVLSGEMEHAEFSTQAESLIESLKGKFSVEVEIASSASAEEGTEEGSAPVDVAGPLEKIDKLALASTMLDQELSDLPSVVEVSQILDELKVDLVSTRPPELCMLHDALAQLYEKYMMGQGEVGDAPEAIEITNDAVSISRDVLSGEMEPDEFAKQAKSYLDILKGKFGIESQAAPATQAKAESGAPAGGPAIAPKPEAIKEPDRTEIKLLDENDAEIYEGFLDESTDQVNKIEEYVMTLEEEPESMDIINSLFRVFHSLKGAAGFLALKEINFLCHEAENLLDKARKHQTKIDEDFIDICLSARDALEKGLANLDEVVKVGRESLPNFTGMCDRLEVMPIVEKINRKLFGYEVLDVEGEKLGQILLEQKAVTADKLKDALKAKEKPLGEILVDMGAASKESVDSALKEQEEKKKKKAYVSTSIKVDTQKLNVLMELVGELVISQSIISQNQVLESDGNESLSKDIVEMAKITGGIQDLIMALRMVPLRQTFQKMNRLVRDLARKTDKQVNFVMRGEDTEIDKTLVEKLNDPLIHLLRNGVDHGIESSEERLESGKGAEGTIELRAGHKGGNVIIEIIDDGKGLNLERIKEKAIERGLMDKSKSYTEDDIINLIFVPGFSTHNVATDLSGRGVGMDVVRRYIAELGGHVTVKTEKGKGSVFLITLPLTMAIVDGMLVQVGAEKYIIPMIAISESLRPTNGQITSVIGKGEVVNVRGELISLIRLYDLLEIPNARTNASESLVIIVGTAKEKRGLLVDDLLGQQQVVIKNLDRRFSGVKGFSGSSILGDGLVGLIVDVAGIFDMASE